LSDTIFSAADRLLLPAGCVVRRKGLEREGDGEVDASSEQIWRGGLSARRERRRERQRERCWRRI
jgi:hypothetical protein